MDSELDIVELFDSSFSVLTSTPRKGSRLGKKPMSESRLVEKQGTSSSQCCLKWTQSCPILVLPSVLPVALEESGSESAFVSGETHCYMILILASGIDTLISQHSGKG